MITIVFGFLGLLVALVLARPRGAAAAIRPTCS
jgi:hypothetical protein